MAIDFVPPSEGLEPGDAEAERENDRPLEQVIEDNIFTTVYIGPETAFSYEDGEVNARNIYDPEVDDSHVGRAREYEIVEMEVELTNGPESNYVDAVLIGDGHNIPPNTGTRYVRQEQGEGTEGEALVEGGPGEPRDNSNDPDVITIDIDNELMEQRPNANGEIERIFTGVVSNSSRLESGAFEILAFWPGFNDLQDGSITIGPPNLSEISPILPDDVAEYLTSNEFTNRRVLASQIAELVGREVTGDTPFPFEVNLSEEGVDINGTRAGRDKQIRLQTDEITRIDSNNSNGVLTRLVESTNSVWDIDRYGTFSIGPPTPDGDIPTAAESHKLRYITEADAGRTSPMWRSIKVIGDGVVSQDGWENSSMVNENPVVLKGNIFDVESEGLAEPTFVYRNMEINTAKEARDILNKLEDKLREQLASGEVEVVGHPEVWPGDAIELPDTRDQPFADERFFVKKVIHRLNNSDGFLTKIMVGGQTNATQSFFEGDVDPQKEYFPADRELFRAAELLEETDRETVQFSDLYPSNQDTSQERRGPES